MKNQVLIIGGGPAGYTAGLYLARSGRDPVIFTGPEPGGQLTLTTEVENFPGFPSPILGPHLMDNMASQAVVYGAKLVHETVVAVDFSSLPFQCQTDNASVYYADSIIIATGASAQWLGLESEAFFRGYGVSSCATCDGRLFQGKPVAVVGGGNSAVEESLYLAQHASRVTLIHRRSFLRAEKILQKRLFDHPKISVLWNHTVTSIEGQENPRCVTGLKVCHQETLIPSSLNVNALFVAIGHRPNTSLFQPWLRLDEHGYILTEKGRSHTSIPGVFAAGDVQDMIYRQAVTAAGQGCMAAMDAERFLQGEKLL